MVVKIGIIKNWAKENRLSKEAVAVKINRSLGTVNNLLAGEPVELATLANVAKAMNIKIDDLLDRDDTGEMPPAA